jgi:tetratricopeptide (TPR) repeat protein
MIAFGAGMSAGAAVDQVSSLEVVDLNPDVFGVAEVFTHENRDVVNDPRFALTVNDGRNALLLNSKRYSVIISDATNPKTFDSWTLYTREFYELVKSRLKPGGVFCQWLVIPLPSDAIKILLNTVREVFPHTSLWCIYGSSQCMVLATPERLALDYEELSRRLEPEWEGSGLAEFGIGDTDKFLSFLLLGEDELGAALTGFSTVNTDDLPHAQFRVKGEIEGVRAFLDLMEHQSAVEPFMSSGLPAPTRERLEAYRSLSRRLHLGFLLNNPGEFEEARAVAAAAGLAPDENIRSVLRYDSKRKEYFEARVASHRDDANAHNSLGYIYWQEGRYDEAIRELERTTELNPDFATAWTTLARVFTDAGRYEDAEEAWLAVRDLNPTRDVLSTARRELDVLHLLRRLSYQPTSAPLHRALGQAYARAGRAVKAAEATRSAAVLGGGDPEVYLELAGMYENLEFVDEALESYRTLAALVPGDERLADKVEEFETLAADPAARQRWLNANQIRLGPRDGGGGHPGSCRRAVQAWNNSPFQGRIEASALMKAASLYEQSIRARADDMHAYADAARIYEALGGYDRAASLWREGLQVMAGDRGAEDHARRLELLHGLETGAGAGDAVTLAEIGVLYRRGGEVEKAIAFFRRALEAEPGLTATWFDLAAACVASGRYPEAIGALDQGLAGTPEPETAGAMAERLGQLRRLVEAAERAPAG